MEQFAKTSSRTVPRLLILVSTLEMVRKDGLISLYLQHRSLDIHITYTLIVTPNTAYYNDLHFHYGYHIYAAAVVANFDPEWGKKMFERVLLLVRNIANPTDDDAIFPTFRMKDWYQGHSWASGIVSPVFLNGRNQESSSESIAAYESVALYGAVMVCAYFCFHYHPNVSMCL
jgi:hypothetical protein